MGLVGQLLENLRSRPMPWANMRPIGRASEHAPHRQSASTRISVSHPQAHTAQRMRIRHQSAEVDPNLGRTKTSEACQNKLDTCGMSCPRCIGQTCLCEKKCPLSARGKTSCDSPLRGAHGARKSFACCSDISIGCEFLAMPRDALIPIEVWVGFGQDCGRFGESRSEFGRVRI